MGVWLCRIMWREVWNTAIKIGLSRLMWGYVLEGIEIPTMKPQD
jgi:hypothetical protein